jgi:hypothetical protein
VAFFKFAFESGFSKQVLAQPPVGKFLFFCSTNFLSSAKFQVGFVESLKSASSFLACVLVNFGFERLCRFLLAKFVVGFVGSQNLLTFFLQRFW